MRFSADSCAEQRSRDAADCGNGVIGTAMASLVYYYRFAAVEATEASHTRVRLPGLLREAPSPLSLGRSLQSGAETRGFAFLQMALRPFRQGNPESDGSASACRCATAHVGYRAAIIALNGNFLRNPGGWVNSEKDSRILGNTINERVDLIPDAADNTK